MQSSAGVIAIAIAGCSCSGKTMVTREMVTSDEHSLVIHQDDYYKLVPPKTEDGLENWDVNRVDLWAILAKTICSVMLAWSHMHLT